MEITQKILGKKLAGIIDIPNSYLDVEVEVVVKDIQHIKKVEFNPNDYFGILNNLSSDELNKVLSNIRNEWEKN